MTAFLFLPLLLSKDAESVLTDRTLDYASKCQEVIKSQLQAQGSLADRKLNLYLLRKHEYIYGDGVGMSRDQEEARVNIKGAQAVYRRSLKGIYGSSWMLISLNLLPAPWKDAARDEERTLTPQACRSLEAKLLPLFLPPRIEKVEQWKRNEKSPGLGWRGIVFADYPSVRVSESSSISFQADPETVSFAPPKWAAQSGHPKAMPYEGVQSNALRAYLKRGPYPGAALSFNGPRWASVRYDQLPRAHPAVINLTPSSPYESCVIPAYSVSFTSADDQKVVQSTVYLDGVLGGVTSHFNASEWLKFADRFPELRKLNLPSPNGEEALIYLEDRSRLDVLPLGGQISNARQTITKPRGLLLLKSQDVFPCELGQGFVRIPFGTWRVNSLH